MITLGDLITNMIWVFGAWSAIIVSMAIVISIYEWIKGSDKQLLEEEK